MTDLSRRRTSAGADSFTSTFESKSRMTRVVNVVLARRLRRVGMDGRHFTSLENPATLYQQVTNERLG